MFLEEDPVTRSSRTRLRRAIGLALALGVVITPNALAKPYADPASVLTPNATTAPQGSIPAANGYSFYRPAVASAIAMKHATYSGSSFYRPAPAKATYYDAWHVPATPSAGGSIAVTHDTWGNDVRTAVPSQPAATVSSSNDTRNILLAASAAGLLLISGGSLVLMLRRRRAQLA
jgi:hypothetical protein